jgi:Fe-S-cluster containining protein
LLAVVGWRAGPGREFHEVILAIPLKLGGSELCLACGLCCNGTLHATVAVRPEDIRHVRGLGLAIEKTGDELEFRQPCPLYQNDSCSVYQHRPPACQKYRCALLKKYEDGDVTLEDSLTIVGTGKQLLAERAGHSAVRPFSGESLLRAAALDVHLEKHFREPKKNGH